jgi:hypothetical protein
MWSYKTVTTVYVFYYATASEIWHDKGCGLMRGAACGGRGLIRGGTSVLLVMN